jgi:hypothetical protein
MAGRGSAIDPAPGRLLPGINSTSGWMHLRFVAVVCFLVSLGFAGCGADRSRSGSDNQIGSRFQVLFRDTAPADACLRTKVIPSQALASPRLQQSCDGDVGQLLRRNPARSRETAPTNFKQVRSSGAALRTNFAGGGDPLATTDPRLASNTR